MGRTHSNAYSQLSHFFYIAHDEADDEQRFFLRGVVLARIVGDFLKISLPSSLPAFIRPAPRVRK